jgi:hypothetical protein
LKLSCSLSNPGDCFFLDLVQGKQTSLPSSLDQLIRLSNELDARLRDPFRESICWGEQLGLLVPKELSNARVLGGCRRTKRQRWVDHRRTSEPIGEQKLSIVLADG